MMITSRYEILSEIGQGAMGTVYHALDHMTGQDVALKQAMPQHDAEATTCPNNENGEHPCRTESLLTPEVSNGEDQISSGSPGSTSDRRLALAREFRLLSSLHHPNIIRVMDYGFEPQQRLPFYTMEHLQEPQTILEAAATLPLEGKVDLLIQLLQALGYLHESGVLHRDVKPSNALVQDGHLTLVDFGISELREEARACGRAGTLSYMAPELHRGQTAASEASDLFAAGVVAYQMLTGRHPYKASSLTLMMINITRGRADLDAKDLPPRLVPALRGLLAADPANRFINASQAIESLQGVLDQQPLEELVSMRSSSFEPAHQVYLA